MNSNWEEFIESRDSLLTPKRDQSARGVAEDLVRVMELIAVHGSTGIGDDPDTRQEYIEALQTRIIATRNIRTGFLREFAR